MAAYVEMDQVTKTYQMGEVTIKAADGISFQVEKGCTVRRFFFCSGSRRNDGSDRCR